MRIWGGMKVSIGGITFKSGIYHGDTGGEKGGCIQFDAYSDVRFKNTRFVQCKASSDGGAIYVGSFSKLRVEGAEFDSCYSGGEGGAIMAGTNSTLIVTNSTFLRTGAFKSGGGIGIGSGNLSMSRVMMHDTFTVYGAGGAVAGRGRVHIYKAGHPTYACAKSLTLEL